MFVPANVVLFSAWFEDMKNTDTQAFQKKIHSSARNNSLNKKNKKCNATVWNGNELQEAIVKLMVMKE